MSDADEASKRTVQGIVSLHRDGANLAHELRDLFERLGDINSLLEHCEARTIHDLLGGSVAVRAAGASMGLMAIEAQSIVKTAHRTSELLLNMVALELPKPGDDGGSVN